MARKPPAPSYADLLALVQELGQRPAMNGGFSKLAKQQDEQCARLEKVEVWTGEWDSRLRGLRKLGYAVLVGLVVTLCKDWIGHVHVHVDRSVLQSNP